MGEVGKQGCCKVERKQIIDHIYAAIGEGRGVVPLIGSGMSAASGIPSGSDYRAYLFHCLQRVFAGTDDLQPWDPRSLRWPAFAEVPKLDDLPRHMIDWSVAVQSSLKEELTPRDDRRPVNRTVGDDRDARWQASGFVADWRATLHLLSRVVRDERDSTKVGLRSADPRVVDSFFVNLTEGKTPNVAHGLLGHLADALRVEVILTTNFDTLIETAFQRLDMPLATFDVHYDASLPDARLVRSRRSLVKLHGGRYGLRADFSLDAYPEQSDIDRFCSYLAPYSEKASEPAREHRQSTRTMLPRDLLVMGVSGEDRRTIGLICHAKSRFPDLRVHWTCYRQSDIDLVRAAFVEGHQEVDRRAAHKSWPPPSMVDVQVALAPDLTLFLLELYQHIFLCLPPSRVGFPAVWSSPPSPLSSLADSTEPRETPFWVEVHKLEKQVFDLRRAGRTAEDTPPGEAATLDKIILVHGPPGASSVSAQAYTSLTGPFHTLWLNLEETFDDADFTLLVLASLARESGLAPPFPLERTTLHQLRRQQLSQLTARAARPFCVFVNARDLSSPAMWKDEASFEALAGVLKWLGADADLTVVVVSWDQRALASSTGAFHECLRDALRKAEARFVEHPTADLGIGGARDLVGEVLTRCERPVDWRFLQFVLGLTLFRHPCHLSALHSWALLPSGGESLSNGDNDDERSTTAAKFLHVLRACKVIRDDAGNNVFMYRDYRDGIRGALVERMNRKEHGTGTLAVAEGHQGIADSYLKLYRSSGDVHAAFETVYHRIQCIKAARQLETDHPDRSPLIESAATEIGVALELLGPEVEGSARPLTLVHLWDELLGEMDTLLRDKERPEKLGAHRRRLAAMQASYLATIGEDAKPPEQPVPVENPAPPKQAAPIAPSDQMLREPHQRLWRREYDLAGEALEDILLQFNEPDLAPSDPKRPGKLLELRDFFRRNQNGARLRAEARRWSAKRGGAWITVAVKALRRYHLLKLYQSEAARLLGEQLKSSDPRAGDAMQKAAHYLDDAERIYLFSAELMRFMEDTSVLQGENALLRAQHGILLSWKGRHREAQRRYVEAYGYLSYVGGPHRPVRWATIDLRRTETFLCQLRKAPREATNETEWRCGLIFDAVAGVERAAYKVRESTVNIRWYGWLRELELAACVEIAKLDAREHSRFARCRDREGLDEWFSDALENGLNRVASDPLRLPRYVDLGCQFLFSAQATADNAARQRILAACRGAHRDLSSPVSSPAAEELREYRLAVAERWKVELQ